MGTRSSHSSRPLGRSALLALLAWAFSLPSVAGQDAWTHTVVAEDLVYPWNIAGSADRLFVTEVAGHIVTIAGNRSQRAAVKTSEPVVHEGGSGLLGMALAPDFERSGAAYLYHTYRRSGQLANKVIEVRHDRGDWRETRVLLRGIPGHALYNGGRIAIGPDGFLYVTTGWVHDDTAAQDLNSLAGKILRLQLDGGVPAGNPFPDSYVWSYGHRNPQGLAWDSDGRLFISEHGESGHDEINVVTRGANYGWPQTVGAERRAGVTPPVVDSGAGAWAPSGVAFHQGRLLVAALGDRSLFAFDPATVSQRVVFSSGDRLRAVLPIGEALYVITSNTSPRASQSAGPDRLLKLTPRP